MGRPPEFEGTRFTIQALELADGSCPAGDFLDQLSVSDRRKLDTLFEMLANKGQISNKQKFKKIEGSNKIFAFKSFQVRLLCFFAGKKVMLAFGLLKKKDKYRSAEIARAEEYRTWFIEEGEGK